MGNYIKKKMAWKVNELQTVLNSKYTNAEDEEIQRIYVSTLCPGRSEPFNTSSYAYELAKLSGGIAVKLV